MVSTSVDKVTSRLPAISFSPLQNSSSRLTLVLWPARTIERLTTGDFMKTPPFVVDMRHTTGKLVRHCGRRAIILERCKNHTDRSDTACANAGNVRDLRAQTHRDILLSC